MSDRRYKVRSRSQHNFWLHEVFDSTTGLTVLEPSTDLSWCFDGAALLESGLSTDETLELLAERPVIRQCGC